MGRGSGTGMRVRRKGCEEEGPRGGRCGKGVPGENEGPWGGGVRGRVPGGNEGPRGRG